jgi:glycogen synthase
LTENHIKHVSGKVKNSVLIISPETSRLPHGMGLLAESISGKSGGLGDVVSTLCEGLIARGEFSPYIALPNIMQRFMTESEKTREEWRHTRYTTAPKRIRLLSSAYFSHKKSIYEGDVVRSAAEFQTQIVNNVIKDVSGESGGKLVIHSHDWMAGGVITAYARKAGWPVLHTVHNVHTGYIPVSMLDRVDLKELEDCLCFADKEKTLIDSHATAIKNATMISYVSQVFLEEVVNDFFADRPLVPDGVRRETKAKYLEGLAYAILNAPSLTLYPETYGHIKRNFKPDDDVVEAKAENLVEFQKRTGLKPNPQAILFYSPSRLDPFQKGVEIIEQVAPEFVTECESRGLPVQVAIIGDPVPGDNTHRRIMGGIAWSSHGRIVYYPYTDELSMLGYAAANDVFGASLFEPCGQIDQVGNLYGATATNRRTGGYASKIKPMQPPDYNTGNGFLFNDYDTGGLLYGLRSSLGFHSLPKAVRLPQMQRIMNEAREYNREDMVDSYVEIYEKLIDLNPWMQI